MNKLAKKDDLSPVRTKNGGMSIKVCSNPVNSYSVVYLLIDCSSSMSSGAKLQQVKDGAKSFVLEAQKKGYSVGLIKFSSIVECLFDPHQNHGTTNLDSCINNIVVSGSTDMTGAIEIAIEKLNYAGSRAILIATDGQPNSLENTLRAAEKAKNLGIEILVIGTDDADINFLRKLATSTKLANKVPTTQFKNAITSMADKLALPSGDGFKNSKKGSG